MYNFYAVFQRTFVSIYTQGKYMLDRARCNLFMMNIGLFKRQRNKMCKKNRTVFFLWSLQRGDFNLQTHGEFSREKLSQSPHKRLNFKDSSNTVCTVVSPHPT